MKSLRRMRYKILALFLIPPVLLTVIFLILALRGGGTLNGLIVVILCSLGALGTMALVRFAGKKLGGQREDLLTQIDQRQRALLDCEARIAQLTKEKHSLELSRESIASREDMALKTSDIAKKECELVVAENKRLENELKLLERILDAFNSDLAPVAILEVVCRELALALDVAQSAAALLDSPNNILTVVSEYLSEGRTSALGLNIPIEGNPATLYVLKNKQPLAVTDAQRDILLAPIHDIMRQRETASLLILPIMFDGNVLGTIGLDAAEQREFSAREIALALRVVGAVARMIAEVQ